MLMVVFGAGASYDSWPSHPPVDGVRSLYRPPLADQLFEERPEFAVAVRSLKKCLPVIPYLRDRSAGSVEQVLQRLQEEAGEYRERLRQLASIRFYLHWIIWDCQQRWNGQINEVTNYRTLIDQIGSQRNDKRVCFVTFNYDTLLEEAFTSFGIRFRSIEEYISRNDYVIIKPHGSVNWARGLDSPMEIDHDPVAMANKMTEILGLDISNNYYIINEFSRLPVSYMEVPGKNGVQPVFPAIAIPVERKYEYVCPYEHIKALEECISKTDKLLIIGWKAAEENFVKLLAKGLSKEIPKMVVSSGSASAEKIKSTLQHSGIDGANWRIAKDGFSGEVRSGSIERFIGK